MSTSSRHQDQAGAVVVEFAVVFGLFVVLLSAIIQYGVIFAAQQSLSHASAEAVRAVVNIADDDEPEDGTADEAESRIAEVLQQQVGWLDGSISPGDARQVDYQVRCDGCVDGAIPPPGDTCGDCIQVTVTYNWADDAIVPTLFRIATPDTLSASANVQYR